MYSNRIIKFSLIDDDPQMGVLLKDFLSEKYPMSEISSYQTGEDALQRIIAPPDLIILDYHLDSVNKSAMNGLQVLKKIKDTFPNVPVIFLSGQEKTEIAFNTLKSGAWDYVVKNESAFNRLEIHINNIIGHVDLKKNLGTQKFFNRLLAVLVLALIVGLLVMRIIK